MTGVRLGAVAVDCSNPALLAEFYKSVLGLEVTLSSPDLVVFKGIGYRTFPDIRTDC